MGAFLSAVLCIVVSLVLCLKGKNRRFRGYSRTSAIDILHVAALVPFSIVLLYLRMSIW